MYHTSHPFSKIFYTCPRFPFKNISGTKGNSSLDRLVLACLCLCDYFHNFLVSLFLHYPHPVKSFCLDDLLNNFMIEFDFTCTQTRALRPNKFLNINRFPDLISK